MHPPNMLAPAVGMNLFNIAQSDVVEFESKGRLNFCGMEPISHLPLATEGLTAPRSSFIAHGRWTYCRDAGPGASGLHCSDFG
jgi:hypothetical protein